MRIEGERLLTPFNMEDLVIVETSLTQRSTPTNQAVPNQVTAPTAQPLAITIQVPPEKHDYVADGISGAVGLLGALIGAYAAYKFGQKAAREARTSDRIERDKELCQSLVQKLNAIYSAQRAFCSGIAAARERLEARKNEQLPADDSGRVLEPRLHINQEVRPFGNLPSRSNIAPEEVNAGGRVAGTKNLSTLMILGERHNGSLDLWSLYASRKAVFDAMVAQWVEYDGQYVVYKWEPNDYEKLRPIIDELDRLVDKLYEQCLEDRESAFRSLKDLLQGMVNRDWISSGVTINDPNDNKIKIVVSTP